jgi:hypothetical protein
MPSIRFDIEHVHPDDATGGIILPVELQATKSVRLFAHVDTGAANCLFQGDYAELLGLTLTDGFPKDFYPASGGAITAFGHQVTSRFLTTQSIQWSSLPLNRNSNEMY